MRKIFLNVGFLIMKRYQKLFVFRRVELELEFRKKFFCFNIMEELSDSEKKVFYYQKIYVGNLIISWDFVRRLLGFFKKCLNVFLKMFLLFRILLDI